MKLLDSQPRTLRPILVATALAACGGCTDLPLPPLDLTGISLPALVRPGTPFLVQGRGLEGAVLRLQARAQAGTGAAAAMVHIPLHADGRGQVPEVPAWRDGEAISKGCVETPWLPGWEACRPLHSTWRPAPTATGPILLGATAVGHGEALPLLGAGLLLEGEGAMALQAEVVLDATGQAIATTVPVQPMAGGGAVQVEPAWFGLAPGKRRMRGTLVLTAGSHVRQVPMPVQEIEGLPPALTALANADLRRGAQLPLTIVRVPDAGWSLHWAGNWTRKGAPVAWPATAPRVLPGAKTKAILASPWFLDHMQPLLGADATFDGTVHLLLRHGNATWQGPAHPVHWPLRPTLQAVVVTLGSAFEAGLTRFGLAEQAPSLRLRILAIANERFAGHGVQVSETAPPGLRELLRVDVLDRDPNGLDLLGADNSPGKDVGNRVLDERLGGFSPATALGPGVPYGGVFLEGFFQWSAKLQADAGDDPAFDALFAPTSPILGGKPGPGTPAAREVLAQLIAHGIVHEVGHALGMAAGTLAYHHAGDHPGWIMDAGSARPFAERAGLPGAAAQTWGPADAAYLAQILPAAGP